MGDAMETIPVLVVFLLVISFSTKYWFLTKMYQSYANYPFQFRLSQWHFTIKDTDKEKIFDFIQNENESKHLLVFGSKRSGKTSLSIGIANELSIKHKTCMYTSSTKLYSQFFEETTRSSMDKNILWTWRDSEVLVIDDINPGAPIVEDLVSASTFLRFIDTHGVSNEVNRKTLSSKNVIWILGNELSNEESADNVWVSMLNAIGVQSDRIEVINLKS
jgi:DNA helicase HerA-like ATPase